VLKSAKLA